MFSPYDAGIDRGGGAIRIAIARAVVVCAAFRQPSRRDSIAAGREQRLGTGDSETR
jgi:hypothetical protein